MDDLRKMMNLKSAATISEYESGRTVPSLNALMLLADATNYRPGWFLGELMPQEVGAEATPYFPAPFSGLPKTYAKSVFVKSIPEKAGHSRGLLERDKRERQDRMVAGRAMREDARRSSDKAAEVRRENRRAELEREQRDVDARLATLPQRKQTIPSRPGRKQ